MAGSTLPLESDCEAGMESQHVLPVGTKVAPNSKPKRKAPWQIIVAAIAALALGACGGTSESTEAYEQAMQHYESGLYQQAADEFESLGDYESSEAMAQKSLLGVAAQEAEDGAEESPEAWEAAAEAYEQLGGTQGESGATKCRNYAAYYRAKNLMEKDKWRQAKKSLRTIKEEGFEDVAALIDECDAHIDYEQAEALFQWGDYYEAYVKFHALEGSGAEWLPDLSERVQACTQDFPDTGALYTNPSYQSSEVPLTIKNSSAYTYYKIYDDDTLAMTVFIQSGDSAKVTLPIGTYVMKEAHGDQWFGEDDMFGDEGRYYRCTFGGEGTATLNSGYSYEISTADDSDGKGVGNEAIDRGEF